MNRVSRRELLRGLGVAVAAPIVSAYGAPQSASPSPATKPAESKLASTAAAAGPTALKKKAKLVFWNNSAQYEPAFKERFLPKYPHIELEFVNMPTDDLSQKLLVSLATNSNLPDIATIIVRRANEFLATNQFLDQTDFFKPIEKDFDTPGALIRYGGKIYGFQTGGGMNALWLNHGELTKHGINMEKLETWDQFTEAALKLKSASKGKQFMFMAFHPSGAYGFNNFNVYFHAREGNWWTADGKPEPKAEGTAKEVLAWYSDLKHKHGIAFEGDWRKEPFLKAAKDKTMLGFTMHYGIGTTTLPKNLPEQKGMWRALTMPLWQKGGPKRTGVWGGSGILGLKATKYPEAIRDLYTWLLSDDGQDVMLDAWGTVHYKPAFALPRFKATLPYFGNQNVRAEFTKRSFSSFHYWEWAKVEEQLGFAVDKVWAQQWKPEQGAREMMKSLAKIASERKA